MNYSKPNRVLRKELEKIEKEAEQRKRIKQKRAKEQRRKAREKAVNTGVPEHLDVCLVMNYKGTPIYIRKTRSGSPMETKLAAAFKAKNIMYMREVKLGSVNFFYDFFLPKTDTIVEYNGKEYHSSDDAKERDARKMQHAITKGFNYIVVTRKNLKEFLDSL
jgi:very-short-patch-repair endonuclease